jgi:hypothetical protein
MSNRTDASDLRPLRGHLPIEDDGEGDEATRQKRRSVGTAFLSGRPPYGAEQG